jgi:hypothetical protein
MQLPPEKETSQALRPAAKLTDAEEIVTMGSYHRWPEKKGRAKYEERGLEPQNLKQIHCTLLAPYL